MWIIGSHCTLKSKIEYFSGGSMEQYLILGIGLLVILIIVIAAVFIAGRCFRQTQILPILPENTTDCSQHDSSWQYSFEMSATSSSSSAGSRKASCNKKDQQDFLSRPPTNLSTTTRSSIKGNSNHSFQPTFS